MHIILSSAALFENSHCEDPSHDAVETDIQKEKLKLEIKLQECISLMKIISEYSVRQSGRTAPHFPGNKNIISLLILGNDVLS